MTKVETLSEREGFDGWMYHIKPSSCKDAEHSIPSYGCLRLSEKGQRFYSGSTFRFSKILIFPLFQPSIHEWQRRFPQYRLLSRTESMTFAQFPKALKRIFCTFPIYCGLNLLGHQIHRKASWRSRLILSWSLAGILNFYLRPLIVLFILKLDLRDEQAG